MDTNRNKQSQNADGGAEAMRQPKKSASTRNAKSTKKSSAKSAKKNGEQTKKETGTSTRNMETGMNASDTDRNDRQFWENERMQNQPSQYGGQISEYGRQQGMQYDRQSQRMGRGSYEEERRSYNEPSRRGEFGGSEYGGEGRQRYDQSRGYYTREPEYSNIQEAAYRERGGGYSGYTPGYREYSDRNPNEDGRREGRNGNGYERRSEYGERFGGRTSQDYYREPYYGEEGRRAHQSEGYYPERERRRDYPGRADWNDNRMYVPEEYENYRRR